jgi:hypothetical protein
MDPFDCDGCGSRELSAPGYCAACIARYAEGEAEHGDITQPMPPEDAYDNEPPPVLS